MGRSLFCRKKKIRFVSWNQPFTEVGSEVVTDNVISEEDLAKTIDALDYAAARRGLYLTVHALNRAREVLRWESAGDREKALSANRGVENESNEQDTVLSMSISPPLTTGTEPSGADKLL